LIVDNYTVQQLATVLQVHENTIYDWLERKVFPHAFKIRKGWRIPHQDVEQAKHGNLERYTATGVQSSAKRSPGFVKGW